MTERPTATGAMARAESAHQKIEDHEKLCAERYGNINSTLDELKKLVWGVILGVAGFALMTLLAVMLHALKLA